MREFSNTLRSQPIRKHGWFWIFFLAFLSLAAAPTQAAIAVSAGEDATVILPGSTAPSVSHLLVGEVKSDDPDFIVEWDVIPDDDVIINNDMAVETQVQFTTPGTYVFSLRAYNILGDDVTDEVVITVLQAPRIITQPAPRTVVSGSTATFSVTATGTPLPQYQWLRGNSLITGATSSTYTTPATTLNDNGAVYSVIVSSEAGEVRSTNALLTVVTPPTLTNANWEVDATVGERFQFALTASGTAPITYSATGLPAWLTLTASTGALAGIPSAPGKASFTVRATNAYGADSAVLTVTTIQPNSAPDFTTHPTNASVLAGAMASFTSAATGYPAPTFQWQRNGTNITGATSASYSVVTTAGLNGSVYRVIATNSEGADTSLPATLTVNTPPQFTNTNWQVSATVGELFNFQLLATGTPVISFSATGLPTGLTLNPTTGLIAGTPLLPGDFSVTVTATSTYGTDSETLNLEIASLLEAPVITTHPANASVLAGATATFTAAATGSPTPTFQWQRNSTNIAGATSATYSVTATAALNGSVYRVIATNSLGSVTSNTATLTVNTPPQFTNTTWSATGTVDLPFEFQLNVTGTPPITFSATGLPPGLTINATTGLISGTPTSPSNSSVTVTATSIYGSDSETLSLQIGQNQTVPLFTTHPVNTTANDGTLITFTSAASGTPSPTYQWQRNGVNIAAATGSSYSITASIALNGSVYRAIASNPRGADTSLPATLTVRYRPVITTQPRDTTVNDGQAASFSVVGNGNPAPSYRWYRNGQFIAGATASSYTTSALTPADSGSTFRVALFNGVGDTVFSNAVTLGVRRIPVQIVSHPSSVTINQGSSATFSITAQGSAPITYQWRRNSVNIATGGNAASYTLTNAQLSDSGAVFDCIVAGATRDTSNPAVLNVRRVIVAPIITNSPLTYSATVGRAASYAITTTGTQPITFSASPLPAGLSINTSTGVISGTPTTTGITNTVITASNTAGSQSRTLVITISPAPVAPVINSSLTATATVGTPFSYTITASGTAPFTFNATPLPSPLTRNGAQITGTPTAAGTYNITLTAQNEVGTDTKTLVLRVNPANSLPVFTVNLKDTLIRTERQSLTLSVTVTGYPQPGLQWQYLNDAGQVTNLGSGNTYTINSLSLVSAGRYRVIATNSSGSVTSVTTRLTVRPLPVKPVITSQPAAQIRTQVGNTVTFSITATATPPIGYQWKKNGIGPSNDIAGANQASLTLSNVKLADAGTYYCMVFGSDVIWTDTNTFSFSAGGSLIVDLKPIDIPKANYPDTTFTTRLQLSLRTDTLGDTIRFTTDRTDPTPQSAIWTEGSVREITTTTEIRARAYKAGLAPSPVLIRHLTYAAPGKVGLALPAGDTVVPAGGMTITLNATPSDAAIWYTLNGDEPTENGLNAFKYDSNRIQITGTTLLKARAFKAGMLPSDIITKQYAQKAVLKVAPVLISPSNPRIRENTQVLLSTATDSTVIWYTTDGSSPFTSPTRRGLSKNETFTVTQSTMVKAYAERANWQRSDSLVFNYIRVPGPILIDPPGISEFDTQLALRFAVQPPGTPIYCQLDGSQPLDDSLNPAPGSRLIFDTLTLVESATLRCVAIGPEKVPSDTVVRFFIWNAPGNLLPTPTANPTSRSFRDTIKVTLNAGRASLRIRYTLNGEFPEGGIGQIYTDTLIIDSTTTIRAVATDPINANNGDSRFMVQTYTLVPDPPTASPAGNAYVGAQKVTLKNRSSKVKMFYTLNGETPTLETGTPYLPGDTLRIATHTQVKAIAVAGNLASEIMMANYEILDSSTQVLMPESSLVLQGTPYTLFHSGEPKVSIQVRLATGSTLPITGFSDISFGLSIQANWTTTADSAVFPTLFFNKPSTETRTLFRLDPDGRVFYVSSGDSIRLQSGGIYFLGHDLQKPQVEWVLDTLRADDSTEIRFTVRDNVSNLFYDFSRSDAPSLGKVQAPVRAPGELTFKLKSPPGELQPLLAHLSVSDGTFTVRLPETPGQSLVLKQSLTAAEAIGNVRLGLKASRGWDLMSLPVHPSPLFTVGALWQANPNVTKHKTYGTKPGLLGLVELQSTDTLRPKQGYWLAANPPTNRLKLPSIQTVSSGQNAIKIPLKKGWNLIGSSVPQRMYWPIPRSLETAYLQSLIKAPWGFDPTTDSYVKSDILEPWRGYWVHHFGSDTTVELSQTPVTTKIGLAKFASAPAISVEARLTRGQPLQLGAYLGADDGITHEDEPSLPESDPTAPTLTAYRQNQLLQSDWVAYRHGHILQWQLVQSATEGGTDPTAESGISLRTQTLPAGYGATLVSRQRKVHYPLHAALQAETLIPAAQGPQDTLTLWVGPQSLLTEALKGYSAGPPAFKARLLRQHSQWSLQLDLPEAAQILWLVCDAQGRIVQQGQTRRAEGRQTLAISPSPTTPSVHAVGMFFLRAELRGKNLNRSLSYRFATLP